MKLVIALGGNALLDASEGLSYRQQERQIAETTSRIAPLCREHDVVLVHGNGPQVGGLMAQQEPGTFTRPLDALVAETQGQIGYLLQRGLQDAGVDAAATVTQVTVDRDDPAFEEPAKPVGPFVDRDTAQQLDGTYRELGAGDRPFRRVVPSPEPRSVRELGHLRDQLDDGGTVIACGGGGVPVDEAGCGVESVIDKDRAAALLGTELDADRLLVLTDIDHAYRDHPADQDPITGATPAELRSAMEDGLFGSGSMRPKVDSAARFVKETGREAVIGSVERPADVLDGDGTVIRPDTR